MTATRPFLGKRGYRIVEELHTMPGVFYRDQRIPPVGFAYAIRRDDNSLVFRSQTYDEALRLLANLEAIQEERVAA